MSGLHRSLGLASLRPGHLALPGPGDYQRAKQAMPPEEVLHSSKFSEPEHISSNNVAGFEDLHAHRNAIQWLSLVPIKSPSVHAYFHDEDPDRLLRELQLEIEPNGMALLPNRYPYALPREIHQAVLWYAPGSSRVQIMRFVAQLIGNFKLKNEELIIFERPINTEVLNVKYVRGSFRQLPHLHFWTKRS